MARFISRRIEGLVQSDIRAMTIACLEHKGINLGQGLCELETPAPVIEEAQRALADSRHSIYSSPEGISKLRKGISQKLCKENGIEADPDREIVVTNGATGGYAATLMALLNPGDGILIFEPYYGYHLNAAILSELDTQVVSPANDSFRLEEEQIRNAIKPHTKAMVLCTPGNPSGHMLTEEEIRVVARIANEYDLLVITDEMYEYFRYDEKEHLSPASFEGLQDRTITLMGLSKTFSITGWRLGYLAGPQKMIEKIRIANDLFYVCAPTPLQYGVAAGFDLDESYFIKLQHEFASKRQKLMDALNRAGMTPVKPEGAYYILADASPLGFGGSFETAMKILRDVGVASIPGRAFFRSELGEKYLRFNFAVASPKLEEACKRLGNLGR